MYLFQERQLQYHSVSSIDMTVWCRTRPPKTSDSGSKNTKIYEDFGLYVGRARFKPVYLRTLVCANLSHSGRRSLSVWAMQLHVRSVSPWRVKYSAIRLVSVRDTQANPNGDTLVSTPPPPSTNSIRILICLRIHPSSWGQGVRDTFELKAMFSFALL